MISCINSFLSNIRYKSEDWSTQRLKLLNITTSFVILQASSVWWTPEHLASHWLECTELNLQISFWLKLSAFLHISPTICIQKMRHAAADKFGFLLCITEDAWLVILIFQPGPWLQEALLSCPHSLWCALHHPCTIPTGTPLLCTVQGITCHHSKCRAVLWMEFRRDLKSYHFIFFLSPNRTRKAQCWSCFLSELRAKELLRVKWKVSFLDQHSLFQSP